MPPDYRKVTIFDRDVTTFDKDIAASDRNLTTSSDPIPDPVTSLYAIVLKLFTGFPFGLTSALSQYALRIYPNDCYTSIHMSKSPDASHEPILEIRR